ncbi:MAG: hypothetical protein ACR2PU_01255 [Gammaproteobacteria bacterium]
MIDCKCSFTATLIKEDFACEKAQMVTRRAGPDIACSSEAASENCANLLSEFKKVGLPAFDAEDDLLKTPHSVFNKIQFGGLLGLARTLNNNLEISRVDNIFQLVSNSLEYFGSTQAIPHQDYIKSMIDFKIQRRKSKR